MRCVAGTIPVLGVSCGRPNFGTCYSFGACHSSSVSHGRVYGDIGRYRARLDDHQRNGYTPGCACAECATYDAQCSHHTQEITAAASFL